jgi:hypothetical protein
MKTNIPAAGLIEEGEALAALGTSPPAALARRDRVFHTGLSVAFLLTAFVGFAPTYFLKTAFHTPVLSPLLHVHGLVNTAWLVLLVIQTSLISARRVKLHMTLGVAGALIAAVLVPVGLMTALAMARLGAVTPARLGFLIFPLGQVLMFGGLVAAALWKRRQPALHKRLIVLATAVLLTPAISRLPFVAALPVAGLRPVLALLLTAMFVAAAMLHDRRMGRRAHPIYVWGGIALLLSGPLRFGLGQTAAWQSIARALVG